MGPLVFNQTQVFKGVAVTIKLAAVCQRESPYLEAITVSDVSIDTPLPVLRLPPGHPLTAVFGEANILAMMPDINDIDSIRSALISRLQDKIAASELAASIPLGEGVFTPVGLLNHLISMNTVNGLLEDCMQ
jgi:hypothetical protein